MKTKWGNKHKYISQNQDPYEKKKERKETTRVETTEK